MIYSFVVPIFNDGDLAPDFCESFLATFTNYLSRPDIEGDCELIFVNDGSRNNSQETLRKCAEKYPFVRAIELSRNFGQHVAISCGFAHAKGQYVGMLNVDQEDPTDEIPKLLGTLKSEDYDLVTGLRTNREKSFFRDMTSQFFHQTLNRLTGHDVPLNCATLRIMNRRYLDAYNSLRESTRYIPGLEMWLGFKKGYVPIRQKPRLRGSSSYTFKRRIRMAKETILSFSDLPLRLVVSLGFIIAMAGLALGFALVGMKLFRPGILPGYTSTVAIVICLGGTQIAVIGVAGLYIGRILKEVQNRPLYVIRSKLNFEDRRA